MTTTPGLEWLTVGATVAYIHGDNVQVATVDKIGKRDVVVTVNGREQKFNINKPSARGTATWLYRSGARTWDRGNELAPLDDPIVVEMQKQQERDGARGQVRRWADEFQVRRDVDTAKKLRDAIDVFLELHEEDV